LINTRSSEGEGRKEARISVDTCLLEVRAASRFHTASRADISCTQCHHVAPRAWCVLIKASEGNELCNEYLMRSPSEVISPATLLMFPTNVSIFTRAAPGMTALLTPHPFLSTFFYPLPLFPLFPSSSDGLRVIDKK